MSRLQMKLPTCWWGGDGGERVRIAHRASNGTLKNTRVKEHYSHASSKIICGLRQNFRDQHEFYSKPRVVNTAVESCVTSRKA